MVGRRDKGHHNDFRFLAEMTGEAVKPPTKTGHEAAREESSTSFGKSVVSEVPEVLRRICAAENTAAWIRHSQQLWVGDVGTGFISLSGERGNLKRRKDGSG